MSDYYTHEHPGDYEVTFCTEDKAAYEAVKKFCRQMSGELMPNEPKYELRPTASLVEDGYKHINRVCLYCGAVQPVTEPRDSIICYYCGAMLGKEEEKTDDGRNCN